MSVLFPKVNKPPQWDYRPIYYDPKRDEMKRKLAELQARRAAEQGESASGHATSGDAADKPYVPTLHRGSFREMHDAGASRYRAQQERKAKMRMWLILLAMLVFFVYLLGLM